MTVSATGYARTDGQKPTIVLRFAPGRSSVAAGVIQVAARYTKPNTGDLKDFLFTVSMMPGRTTRFESVFPPEVESDLDVNVFEEFGSIVVQVVRSDSIEIDWTARIDLVLVAAHTVTP